MQETRVEFDWYSRISEWIRAIRITHGWLTCVACFRRQFCLWEGALQEDNKVLKQCQYLCLYSEFDGGPRDYSITERGKRERPVTMVEMPDIGAGQAAVRDPPASAILCKRPRQTMGWRPYPPVHHAPRQPLPSHPRLLYDKQNLLLVLWWCWCIYPIVVWPSP